ncbi:MAG: HAMP domain-containing protein [Limnochordaceae bacterium]|nr:HAMP domain-containing protein [Limnochordaceae bacterium]
MRGLTIHDVAVGTNGHAYRFLDFVQALPDPQAPVVPPGSSGPSYVRVGVPLAPIEQFAGRLATVMGAVVLLFALGGGAVALALYRGVLGPLDRLVVAVEQLRAGDLGARARVKSGDELQLVADEFNRMAGGAGGPGPVAAADEPRPGRGQRGQVAVPGDHGA